MNELEHVGDLKASAERKALELNQLAGYARFSMIATPLPGQSATLRDSWSIKDSKTGKTYAYGSIAGSIGLSQLTNSLKKNKVDAVSQVSPKTKRSIRHDDFNESELDEDLEHYGVLGMKWGVRKDPDRAYRKSVDKLKKLDTNADKAKIKAAKSDLKSAKKYEKKSAKYENKAAKLQVKSSKIGRKDSKLEMKARKLRMKAPKSWTKSGYVKKIRKAEKLEYKSSKKEYKSSKYQLKADKASRKAAKSALKAANLRAGTAGKTLKSLKYDDKAKKWANKMNEVFHDIPIKSFDASDIAIGQSYGVTFINEYMKNKS